MTATAFSDQPWGARFSVMGDASEEKYVESVEGKCERFGLNRPEGVHVPSLPARLRAAPDYLESGRLVECVGLGRDQLLKLKLEKHGVLRWWDQLHPVDLFVWDSHKKRSTRISIGDLDALIQTPDLCSVKYFDGRKLAFCIPADAIFNN